MGRNLARRLTKLETAAAACTKEMLDRLALADRLMMIPGQDEQPGLVERVTYWASQESDQRRRRIAELLLIGKERYEQANGGVLCEAT